MSPTFRYNFALGNMLPDIAQIIARIIASEPAGISVENAARVAVNMRPQAYGLSIEYALRRYRAYIAGTLRVAKTLSRLMWQELAQKVQARMQSHPDEDDFAALEYILTNDAPSSYYLDPDYAAKHFYRLRSLSRASRLPASPSRHRYRRARSR